MSFIRTKIIKGQSYRYLVETHKTAEGKKSQKVLKYLGSAPILPDDAPTAVILFSGGGGIECGLVQAGIRPIVSVECDPTNLKLSTALANNNHLNFNPYGGKVIRKSIQELAAAGYEGFPANPHLLHASPVCSNFSQAKANRAEVETDITAAQAVAKAIHVMMPRVFTLENVPKYQTSQSWRIIEDELERQAYGISSAVLDAADHGTPQSRKRFIVKATKGKVPGLPSKTGNRGWFSAIEDLIPGLPESNLLPAQQTAVDRKLAIYPGVKALLIERTGYRDGEPQIREPIEPCWTIKRSIFTDGKGANRSRFIDLWQAGGEVKALNLEAIARLQGFPKWYYLPDEFSVAGSILGYSVPPLLAMKLVA